MGPWRSIANRKMLTPKGDNLVLCQMKAFAFRLVWKEFIEHQDADRLAKPPFVSDEAWEQVAEALSGYASLFEALENAGLDALLCSQLELEGAFEGIARHRLCSPEESWKEIATALFAVGREHAWEEGQRLELFDEVLVNTRNPASGALPESVLQKKVLPDVPIKVSFTEHKAEHYKRKRENEATSPQKRTKKWDWIPENIEPGNFVVVLAKNPDRYALALPGLDVKVWVVEAKVYNKKSGHLLGSFHFNKEGDLNKALTHTTKDRVKIDERCVLSIYALDVDEDFKLTKENIREIESYARLS